MRSSTIVPGICVLLAVGSGCLESSSPVRTDGSRRGVEDAVAATPVDGGADSTTAAPDTIAAYPRLDGAGAEDLPVVATPDAFAGAPDADTRRSDTASVVPRDASFDVALDTFDSEPHRTDTSTVVGKDTLAGPETSANTPDTADTGARADRSGTPSSILSGLTSCQLSRDPASLASDCIDVPPPTNVSMPPLYDGTEATVRKSPFGADYFRITLPNGMSDTAVRQMVPDYAKVPPWNADGTRLLLYSQNGFWHLLDGNTYAYIEELNPDLDFPNAGQDQEPRWSNSDPNTFYFVGGMNFYSYNIATHKTSVVHSFTAAEIGMTCSDIHNGDEGNSDDSNRYWAFYCINSSYQHQGMLVYDRVTDTVLAHKNLAAGGMCGSRACPTIFNWVGISHSGNHVLVNWDVDADDNDLTTRGLGQEVFDRQLNYVSKSSEKNWHCDVTQLADGTDVFVGGSHFSDSNAYQAIRAVRLDDGAVLTSCMVPDFQTGYHISGRTDTSRVRSWVLLSIYDQDGRVVGAGVFGSEVFAMNMDTCEVRRIAHAQSFWGAGDNGYAAEPHAAMDFDFTKVVWGSNWRVQNGPVSTYVARW